MDSETLRGTLKDSLESVDRFDRKQHSYNLRFGKIGKISMFGFYYILFEVIRALGSFDDFMTSTLLFIGYIALLIMHLRKRKQAKKRIQSELEDDHDSICDNYIYIPRDYCTYDAVKTFIKYLENMRADDLKECITLYHDELDKEEIKEEFKKNTRAMKDVDRSIRNMD